MKKSLIAALVGLAATAPAHALIVDIDAGVGTWVGNYNGYLVDESYQVKDTLGLETTSSPSHAFVELRHPLPVIPNLRVAYTQIQSEGVGTLSDFGFGDSDFDADAEITTSLDLTHFDTNLFYELNFIPYTAIQAGIGARFYQGGIGVKGSVTELGVTETREETLALDDFPLPQLTLGARFDIPLTDFYVKARADGLGVSAKTQILDWQVGAGYELDLIPLFDLRLEAGWRELRLALDPSDFDNSDISDSVDTRLSGAYFTAGLVF